MYLKSKVLIWLVINVKFFLPLDFVFIGWVVFSVGHHGFCLVEDTYKKNWNKMH